jgi:hypothetical protein
VGAYRTVEYSEIRGSYVIQRRHVVPRGSCAFRVCSVSWATESHTAAKQLSSHTPQHIIPILDLPSPSPTSQLCCQLRGGLGECL